MLSLRLTGFLCHPFDPADAGHYRYLYGADLLARVASDAVIDMFIERQFNSRQIVTWIKSVLR